MSPLHYSRSGGSRQHFPDWLFGPSILSRLIPVALSSKAPAVDPATGQHRAFGRPEWPDAHDVDQWLRTRWLPRCNRWRTCTRCVDLPEASPMPGCNLGVRSGRLWRGAPSLTIFDVDRVDLFPGLPEDQQSGRVETPLGDHYYLWSEGPMPPEDRPWGELRQGLNEYVVAPGSVYPWGFYTPVEPFQIPFWPTKTDTNTWASRFRLQSARNPGDREPASPPRHRGLKHRDRRALLGQPANSAQRHNALQGRIMRALGLLELRGDRGAILGLLREHNAVFTGPDGFTPDPLSEWEIERLSRSYARMERPAEHTPAFLDRQAQKSAKANIAKTGIKDEMYATIRASAEGGMCKADLAALHGVSRTTVWRALRSFK